MKSFCLVAIVSALAISGCAFTTGHATPPFGAVAITAKKPLRIELGRIIDRRSDGRVGVKKNGYGWITADVIPTKSVQEVVRESLAESLARTHPSVSLGPSNLDTPTWRIDGEILQYLAESAVWKFEGTGEVALRIRVTTPSGAIYRRVFVGHRTVGLCGDACASEALAGALRDAIKQTLVGIDDLAFTAY